MKRKAEYFAWRHKNNVKKTEKVNLYYHHIPTTEGRAVGSGKQSRDHIKSLGEPLFLLRWLVRVKTALRTR